MYLSDRDIDWAVRKGFLIVEPYDRARLGPSGLDVRLGPIDQAKIWDAPKLAERLQRMTGGPPFVYLGGFNYGQFSGEFLTSPPDYVAEVDDQPLVSRNRGEVIIRPGGFLLWQTLERLGTPEDDPRYICFIDGKSTRARTGIVVHLTAPTIHAGWSGNVVLEIANLGPLTFALRPGDVIAQLTVARLSSAPELSQEQAGSQRLGRLTRQASHEPAADLAPISPPI